MESALIVPMNSSRGLQQRPSKSKGLLHEAGRVLIGHKRTFVLIADELILRLQPICYRITLASIQDSGLMAPGYDSSFMAKKGSQRVPLFVIKFVMFPVGTFPFCHRLVMTMGYLEAIHAH